MMSSTIPSNSAGVPGVPPTASPSKAQAAPGGVDEDTPFTSPVGNDTFSTDSSDGPVADSSIPTGSSPKAPGTKPQQPAQPQPGQDASVSGASFDTVA